MTTIGAVLSGETRTDRVVKYTIESAALAALFLSCGYKSGLSVPQVGKMVLQSRGFALWTGCLLMSRARGFFIEHPLRNQAELQARDLAGLEKQLKAATPPSLDLANLPPPADPASPPPSPSRGPSLTLRTARKAGYHRRESLQVVQNKFNAVLEGNQKFARRQKEFDELLKAVQATDQEWKTFSERQKNFLKAYSSWLTSLPSQKKWPKWLEKSPPPAADSAPQPSTIDRQFRAVEILASNLAKIDKK